MSVVSPWKSMSASRTAEALTISRLTKSVRLVGAGLRRAGLKPLPSSAANAEVAATAKAKVPSKATRPAKRGRAPDAKPKNGQTQAELDAALRGDTAGGSDAEPVAARTRAAKKGAKRGAVADPLLRHGYATQGPIAAGAFSTIVRAKSVRSGQEVAVKVRTGR
jgi:hypothetical protein